MRLVDTDVLIDVQRGHAAAIAWFASLKELPAIPGFVAMEMVQDAHNRQQVDRALRLIKPLPIVWPTPADCARALDSFVAFHLSDGLGLLDALIASCAVGLNAPLCTFNTKHYRVVPGLVLEQPYSR